jgi:hypothetical protein
LVGIENIGKFQFQTINCGPDEAKSQRRTTKKREELEKGCDTVAAGHQQFLDGVLYHLNLNRKENAAIMEM